MRHVAGIPGSLHHGSITAKLLHAFTVYAPANIQFVTINISQLPMFNEDAEQPEPEAVTAFKRQIASADGILLVTPEYNRSYTPVLKNALDWGSRPKTAPGTTVWGGKPVAIVGCSPYSLGAFGAVHHLRQVLTFLNMPTVQQPEFYLSQAAEKFNDQGELMDQNTIKHIQNLWAALDTLIDKTN